MCLLRNEAYMTQTGTLWDILKFVRTFTHHTITIMSMISVVTYAVV